MDRNFKRRELEHELRHEDEWNRKQASMPQLKGYYFYNIPPERQDNVSYLGIKRLKSGKFALPIYDKSGRTTWHCKGLADKEFGQGKWWSPNEKKIKENENTTVSNVAQDKVAVTSTNNGIKTTTEFDTKESNPFSRDKNGKLTIDKTKLPANMLATNTQQSSTGGQQQAQQQKQQQAPKPGETVQLASVDAELDSIRKNAGL